MTAVTCPECLADKHHNCDGTAWDFDLDIGAVCACWFDNGGPSGGPCMKGRGDDDDL